MVKGERKGVCLFLRLEDSGVDGPRCSAILGCFVTQARLICHLDKVAVLVLKGFRTCVAHGAWDLRFRVSGLGGLVLRLREAFEPSTLPQVQFKFCVLGQGP